MSFDYLGLKPTLFPPQPLGQKFSPIQAPFPLGFAQEPLGEYAETEDFLSFSVEEKVNLLQLNLSEQSRKVENTDNQEFQSLGEQRKKDRFSSSLENTESINLKKQTSPQTTSNQSEPDVVRAKIDSQSHLDSSDRNIDPSSVQANLENQQNFLQSQSQTLSSQTTQVKNDSTPQNTESINLQEQASPQTTSDQSEPNIVQTKIDSSSKLNQVDFQAQPTELKQVEDNPTSQNIESINLQEQASPQTTSDQSEPNIVQTKIYSQSNLDSSDRNIDPSFIQPNLENQQNFIQSQSQTLSSQTTQVKNDSTPQNTESINLQEQASPQTTSNQSDPDVVQSKIDSQSNLDYSDRNINPSFIQPNLENQQNFIQPDSQTLSNQETQVKDDSASQNTESINLQEQASPQTTSNQSELDVVQAKLDSPSKLNQIDVQAQPTELKQVEDNPTSQNIESINLQEQVSPQTTSDQSEPNIVQTKIDSQSNLDSSDRNIDPSSVQPNLENQQNFIQPDSQTLSNQDTQIKDDSTPQNTESIKLQEQASSQTTSNQSETDVVRAKIDSQSNLDLSDRNIDPSSVQSKLENQHNLIQSDSQTLSNQEIQGKDDSNPQNTESINLKEQASPQTTSNQSEPKIIQTKLESQANLGSSDRNIDPTPVQSKLENQQNFIQSQSQTLSSQTTQVKNDSTPQNTESINLQEQTSPQTTSNQSEPNVVQTKIDSQSNLGSSDRNIDPSSIQINPKSILTEPTSDKDNSISPNTESISLQKQTSSQVTSNPSDRDFVRDKLENQISDGENLLTPQTVEQQIQQKLENTQESISKNKNTGSQSELPKNSPSETEYIQLKLNNQNLSVVKPLTKASPIIDESHFQLSELVNEFSENQLETKLKNQPENKPYIFEQKQTEISDSWSNISELLGTNINSRKNTSSSIENEVSPESLFVSPSFSKSVSGDISAPIEISSPFDSNLSDYESNITNTSIQEEKVNIEEKLECMAEYIYDLLRNQLKLDLEKQGSNSAINMTGFDCTNLMSIGKSMQKKNSEINLLDKKINTLSHEVYLMIQEKLMIEQKR